MAPKKSTTIRLSESQRAEVFELMGKYQLDRSQVVRAMLATALQFPGSLDERLNAMKEMG